MNTAQWQWARIGVCPFSALNKPSAGSLPVCANPFETYACEVIRYTGFLVEWFTPQRLAGALSQIDILLTLGEGELEEETRTALRHFVERGGVWIAIGGAPDAWELVGCAPQNHPNGTPIRLGEGYAAEEAPNPVFPEAWGLLHGFGGCAVKANSAEVWASWYDPHGRRTDYPALTHHQVGAGHVILFAVHLGETILRIRMGRPVSEHAVLPPDIPQPTEPCLRSEDATRLDWYLDRSPCEDGTLCFLKPVADLWQESLIRAILQAGQWLGCIVPMVWFYPRLLPGVGILTVDSEPASGNYETHLNHLMTLTGTRGVWCVSELVHHANFYRDLARREHEIGLRFVPDPRQFCKPSTLQNQVDNLRRFTGVRAITAVQVEELRWRGCSEFYEYVERAQILTELSRGGYHPQASGFVFGSAHAWRPMSQTQSGEILQVYSVPLLAYRVMEWVSPAQGNTLFRATKSVYGVFHVGVRPSVLAAHPQSDALMRMIGQVRYEGYEWTTACDLANWLTARAHLRYRLAGLPGQLQLALLSAQAMNRLGVLLFTPLQGWAQISGHQIPLQQAEFFGFPCLILETDLVEKSAREVNLFEIAKQVA